MQSKLTALVPRRRWILTGVLILVGLLYISQQRPLSHISLSHQPDETHVHQVFNDIRFTQRIVNPTATIDGVEFFLDITTVPSDTAPVIVHIRESGLEDDLRTITGPFSSFRTDASTFYVPFHVITNAQNKPLDIVIEVTDTPKSQALRLRYQSAAEKYPKGKSFTSIEEKQGNLGFQLYERPTVATLIARWMLYNPRNTSVWAGIGLILFGTFFLIRLRNIEHDPPEMFTNIRTITPKNIILAIIGGIAVTLIIWWPATNLFYIFDDVPLLARGQYFGEHKPWELPTARGYIGQDLHSHFIIPHWRPLSAGLYPWLTAKLFGLNAAPAFILNLSLMGLTGSGLILLGYLLFRQWPSSILASLVWLAHSTRTGIAYWWSSSQDIIASLLFVFALLTYVYWRASTKKIALVACLGLFILGLLSKEHVLLLPVILFALEWMAHGKLTKQLLAHICLKLSPLAIVAGAFLILRAVMLWDPVAADLIKRDDTYDLTTSPIAILKNITVLSVRTVEHQHWPVIEALDSRIQPLLDPVPSKKPIYPGILLILTYIFALTLTWKNARIRSLLLFAGLWWVVLLGPTLLVKNIWYSRWLHMPIYGLGIAAGLGWMHLPQKAQRSLIVVLLLIGTYGYWQARVPIQTQMYREQSAYTRAATEKFKSQAENLQDDSVIYVTGVTENQTTSITDYLFYLTSGKELPILRVDALPPTLRPQDIVIDMTGHDALYPESGL